MSDSAELRKVCGQLLVCGFDGSSLPRTLAEALAAGERGGVILFRRNLPDTEALLALTAETAASAPSGAPPFIAIDEEGGRVSRLPAPLPRLPAMRDIGRLADPALVERAAAALGAILQTHGVTLDFAPVLDVDSNPDNPVIGDRSFGSDPALVSALGVAFARGLQAAGIIACGKHFPGHGDTALDSHLALPRLEQPIERLHAVELPPFRAAARAGVPAIMTAHVVFEALDPGTPATLSGAVLGRLLRDDLGFRGVVFSDDLEMRALADRMPVEDSAVAAIEAGCDVLLVCHDESWQSRAHEALIRRAERDAVFAVQCRRSAARALGLRRAYPLRPSDADERTRTVARLAEVLDDLQQG